MGLAERSLARNALQQSSPACRVTAVSEMSRERKESSQVLAHSNCRHNATEVGLCSPSALRWKKGGGGKGWVIRWRPVNKSHKMHKPLPQNVA